MAQRQKENTKRKFSFKAVVSCFRNMDPHRKTLIARVCGLAVGAFAVFTFFSCLSYLFSWKSDYSIVSSAASSVQDTLPANTGSRLGLGWSRFLVNGCFGLSAFVIVGLLGYLAVRIFRQKLDSGCLRTSVLMLTGAPLLSFILSFFAGLFGPDTFFGGGLGGYAGAEFIRMCQSFAGKIGAGLLLLVLSVIWLLFASGRFAQWFAQIGTGKKKQPAVSEETGEGEAAPAETSGTQVSAEDNLEDADADGNGPDEDNTEEDGDAEDVAPEGVPAFASDSTGSLSVEPIRPQTGGAVPDSSEGTPAGGSSAAGSNGEEAVAADTAEGGRTFNTEVTEELPRIDNRMELVNYKFPSLDLLEDYADKQNIVTLEEQQDFINRIRQTLLNFRIKVENIEAKAGPTVTLYKVYPAPGVKLASIKTVESDIGISLGAKGVRVVKLEDAVGIEVANRRPSVVPLKAMLNDEAFRNTKAELPVAIGCTITRNVKVFDLTQAPHLLVAGATQQGKSVGLNVIVSSLLYAKHPSELKFVFVDPKMVEFTAYKRLLKHYLAVLPTAGTAEEEAENAIIKKAKDAADVLNSLCIEMDERYALLASAGVNKLKDYNEKYKDRKLLPTEGHKYLPYIVVVIDEFADLTMSSGFGSEGKALARGISTAIIRLAQKGRAAGIHLIIATQRPSVSVITGDIKTNFPMRIAFRTVSRVDSQTILDSPGAESLIGRGDMLFYAGVEMERVQCALVETKEIDRITKFIEAQDGYRECYTSPYYLPTPPSQDDSSTTGPIDISNIDNLFGDAARLVVNTQKGSTSDLQRKLGLGYARAGKIMDQLEAAGIVGPQEGSKPRQVLVSDYEELESIITAFTTNNA